MGDPLRHSLPATPCPNAPHNLRALLSYPSIALLSYEARDARRRLDGRVARFVLGGMAGQVRVLRLRREAVHLHPSQGGRNATHFRLDL